MSIIVSGLGHTYHQGTPLETCALRDISFEFPAGTWFSVVGHTGSGKSTLAQHLNGILLPMEGRILIDGLEVKEKNPSLREIRRKVGLVFQYPEQQLFAETVSDELAFAPRNWGVPEDDIPARVAAAAGQVGLDEGCLGRSPFHLSGGEKRKAAIASVLSSRPDYLVLDEPTAGLDSFSRKELTRLLSDLRNEGMGILLVTHDLDIALRMSDRILVLDGGRQSVCDTPAAVLAHLGAHPVTGLGLPEIAALSAALRERGKDVPLTWNWKEIKSALFGSQK
ncbi:ATP-binding cassette domain-containing protein [Aminivibrio sp.]|jgi:energy-coupling factor transport system ATP-binding protein|uniref:ATP-binding cassette domain-containing protein n=1 Tax=Aminivibrio sp. TaxID=1872489 RepID=UPI001A5B97E5|nr:ATP-binding cassette domain-containing protein [Aminivibrio sp.]MBL3539484.1 energy-coupling factor transporter ATPase [Aminivibrio sp.]MDK2959492.1 energy-coupling factor transport system ATP-binding protein [Synergistaceae bacterium]